MSPTEALNPAPLLKPGPGRKHIRVSLPCSTIKSRSLKIITSTVSMQVACFYLLWRWRVSAYCGAPQRLRPDPSYHRHHSTGTQKFVCFKKISLMNNSKTNRQVSYSFHQIKSCVKKVINYQKAGICLKLNLNGQVK